jgi:sec-independent protein translocase protein TatA
MIGTPEIIVLLAIALLIFGPKKLPEVGRSLGLAMRELRRASNDLMSTIDSVADTDEDDTATRKKGG